MLEDVISKGLTTCICDRHKQIGYNANKTLFLQHHNGRYTTPISIIVPSNLQGS